MNLSIKNITNKHPEFCFFFMAVVVIIFQFFVLRHEVILEYDNNNKVVTYGLRSLADAIILLMPYWVLPAKYRHWIWLIIILFTVWTLSQLWYYRTYNDLMPFTSFTLLSNISFLLIKSIKASIHMIDWSIIISLFLLLFCDISFFCRNNKRIIKYKERFIPIFLSILFAAFVHFANASFFYIKGKGANSIFERYTNSLGYAYYFNMNGFVALGIHSIIETVWENQELTKKEMNQIKDYFKCHGNNYIDNTYSASKGKNLILIIIESLNSWVIDFKINNIEVTPFLNYICSQDSTIVALKVQPQVKDGRSSDAHFMYNTGILPLKKGSIATKYGDTTYPSLAKALRGYKAVEFICDDAKFWNQKVTASSYGFEYIYDRNSMHYVDNGVVKDGDMFQFASIFLEKEKQPFYAQLVTISMHQPYNELTLPATKISQCNKYSAEVRNYLEAVHYCDNALSKFIQNLKSSGLYAHSVIAIISDHNEMNKNIPEGRKRATPNDKEIAMIVLNTPCTLKYQGKLGQIDIYPTLLDIMGANDYSWKGLGRSIFRRKEEDKIESEKMWNISSLLTTKRYFNNYIFQ